MKTEPYAVYRGDKKLFELAWNGVIVFGEAPNRKFIVPNVVERGCHCRMLDQYDLESAAYVAAEELDAEEQSH